ncbi:MAG TPA: peptidoglycan-binding protein [Clostridiales bacterium]|nr:peptidoglycan-binding protein [Clostridiales bacterium]
MNSYPFDKRIIYPAQLSTQSIGYLDVRCTRTNLTPVENATISISSSGSPQNIIEEFKTDSSGLIEGIPLYTPSIDYSLEPSAEQPYAEYNISVRAPGFESVVISDSQLLADVTAEQDVMMLPLAPIGANEAISYVIPPHTLFGDYPPKIAEDEIKPVGESGEIVLQNVVIPEFVIVHDGPPNSKAKNSYVRFRDYIKNVASSEIYATWPDSAIYANILAILSFTLNRVFTEWYFNKGYNFTITSSTAYDHKWMPGRNIYNTIGLAVDNVFVNFLSRPGILQPILTQYCDGNNASCPGWMTQWGSKNLADQGRTPIEILRHYYGPSIFINTATEVSGVPQSWPGENLVIGTKNTSVRQMQAQLNRIAETYTEIPKIAVDGSYGPATSKAVSTFQKIFKLPVTGVVDFPTWYKISGIYVAVSRIAEL